MYEKGNKRFKSKYFIIFMCSFHFLLINTQNARGKRGLSFRLCSSWPLLFFGLNNVPQEVVASCLYCCLHCCSCCCCWYCTQVLTKGPQELLNKPHPRWRHSRPFSSQTARLLVTTTCYYYFRFILFFFSSYLSYIYFCCDTWNIL